MKRDRERFDEDRPLGRDVRADGHTAAAFHDEEVGHSAVGAHAEGNVQRTTVGMTGDAIAARSARLARPRGDAGADGQA